MVVRLERAERALRAVEILGKFNGAVGNFNAHAVAYPEVDWRDVSARFVGSLGLDFTAYTTQIEPHDWIAEYAHALSRYNTVIVHPAGRTQVVVQGEGAGRLELLDGRSAAHDGADQVTSGRPDAA